MTPLILPDAPTEIDVLSRPADSPAKRITPVGPLICFVPFEQDWLTSGLARLAERLRREPETRWIAEAIEVYQEEI